MTKPKALTVNDYVNGIESGDRNILARAITLVESRKREDETMAQETLQRILPRTGKARRIGISGVPGVGKSTFIESLGCQLVEQGHKVAVLTIDPSSTISGGSILGDKTRMDRLSREANAFIRPSATGGNQGGVARRTREAMLLCEASGFDTIIVESIGVGQGETTLRSMVDYFLLLLLPGAGDELQGIKKGIMEIADDILINKADGENQMPARQARMEQQAALQCLRPATEGWRTEVNLCSARTGQGVTEAWQRVESFYGVMEPRGIIRARRSQQMLEWLEAIVADRLRRDFYDDPRVTQALPGLREALLGGELTAVQAAESLFAARNGELQKKAGIYDQQN